MIVFNVKADGTVDTMPSIVPQASSLADIVVLSAYDYAYCYLHLTPPSGVYIPDVVCTPVLTTDRQVTLWTAPMPAEVTKIGGNVGYTIYFKAKDGTTQRTNPGTFPVPRTEISTVNEDGKFIKRVVTKDDEGNDVVSTVAVDETNYGEIYQVIADIYQAFVSLNREQLENTNLLEVLDDLLQGYNRDPDENRTGAVMASVKAVDQKVETNKTNITANAAAIAANAKNISTNTQNLTALADVVNNPDHGLSSVERKLTTFLDVDDHTRDQLSEVLGLIENNGDQIADLIAMGGTIINRVTKTGNGGNVDVEVKNNTLYRVSGYNTITILPPEGNYTAHLFVEFPSAAEAVGFVLPKDMEVSGNDPSTAAKGERWEVSLDSMGGAIFLRKAAS